MPIKEFLREFATLCDMARSILNRCERVILLRKDLQVFIKRKALIWAGSRLCVSGNGGVWWEVVFERTESCYLEKRIAFFHRNKDNVQSSFSSTACGVKHALTDQSQNMDI